MLLPTRLKGCLKATGLRSSQSKSFASYSVTSKALTMESEMEGRASESSLTEKPAENDMTVVTISQTRRRERHRKPRPSFLIKCITLEKVKPEINLHIVKKTFEISHSNTVGANKEAKSASKFSFHFGTGHSKTALDYACCKILAFRNAATVPSTRQDHGKIIIVLQHMCTNREAKSASKFSWLSKKNRLYSLCSEG